MYYMYLRSILVPVMPEKITMKIGNRNKTIDLANDGEVNLLKSPALTDIEFALMIPNVELPFANYRHGFKGAYYYLEYIERLKTKKEPFSFIVYRYLPTVSEMILERNGETRTKTKVNQKGKNIYQTAMKVTLEEYTIEEAAEEGFDCIIKIKLKQWKEFGTKVAKIKKTSTGKQTVTVKQSRTAKKIKLPTTHKVTKKDTIWILAKKYYGDELKYLPIWKANKKKLKNPEDLKVGMKLKIPKLDSGTQKSKSK